MLEDINANTVIYTELMNSSIETVIMDQLPIELLLRLKNADISTLLGLEQAANKKIFMT